MTIAKPAVRRNREGIRRHNYITDVTDFRATVAGDPGMPIDLTERRAQAHASSRKLTQI